MSLPVWAVQSKYKTTRFSCKQRGALLSILYQCMALAADSGQCGIATKVLGCASSNSLLAQQTRCLSQKVGQRALAVWKQWGRVVKDLAPSRDPPIMRILRC